jgi:transcriptional regulator with XRE-family HTH domain
MTVPPESPDHGGPPPKLEWSLRLARDVAAQVRYWRERRGITAAQLADRTAQLGYQIPRSIIANLENRRRNTIAIAEVLVLAAALDVPPVLLIAPVGRRREVEILPGLRLSAWRSRGWIHGAVEPEYGGFSAAAWQQSRRAIVLYDVHRLLVREHQQIERRIKRQADSEHLGITEIVADAQGLTEGALVDALTELTYSLDRLRRHRSLIRSERFALPDLPPSIAVALQEAPPAGRHSRKTEEADDQLPAVFYDELRASRPMLGDDEGS